MGPFFMGFLLFVLAVSLALLLWRLPMLKSRNELESVFSREAAFLLNNLVLVGIGVIPCQELAEAAGLACSDGIVVDRNARTADPHIWAAGDCTRHTGREGLELRLECVQNAIDQAKHAAYSIVGRPKTYSEVPWFWSDQYDLKLQIAGLARPTDTLVRRGDPSSRKAQSRRARRRECPRRCKRIASRRARGTADARQPRH